MRRCDVRSDERLQVLRADTIQRKGLLRSIQCWLDASKDRDLRAYTVVPTTWLLTRQLRQRRSMQRTGERKSSRKTWASPNAHLSLPDVRVVWGKGCTPKVVAVHVNVVNQVEVEVVNGHNIRHSRKRTRERRPKSTSSAQCTRDTQETRAATRRWKSRVQSAKCSVSGYLKSQP